jgi:hypothetical protein
MNQEKMSQSNGGVLYTRKLFFYSEEIATKVKEYSMTNDELIGKFGRLVDTSERIERVWDYTHPLNWWQLSQNVMHHAFIVFKTKSWWWSIEKNNANITVQRSKSEKSVRDKCCGQKRQVGLTTGITVKNKCKGEKTVAELIRHIHEQDYLNQDYDLVFYNCQSFAARIYEFLTGEFDLLQEYNR